jgi:hypothetical protein
MLVAIIGVGAVSWAIWTQGPKVSFVRYEREGRASMIVFLVQNETNQPFFYYGSNPYRPLPSHYRRQSSSGWETTMQPASALNQPARPELFRVEPGERFELRFLAPTDPQQGASFQLGIRFYRESVFGHLPWEWREPFLLLFWSLQKPSCGLRA